MARFGRQPVKLAEGVKVEIAPGEVVVTGPKGTVSRELTDDVEVVEKEGQLWMERKRETKTAKALQGTMRSHLVNMVKGVTEGWSRALEIVGAGYRAQVSEGKLVMSIGYSHPVEMDIPEGLSVKVEKNVVTIEGADKEKVGQFAATVRGKRPPEPYKGAGIRYQDEVVRRKAGKQASGAGAA